MLKSSGKWALGCCQLLSSNSSPLSPKACLELCRLLRLIRAEWSLAPPRQGQGLPLPMRKYQANPTGSMTTETTLSHSSPGSGQDLHTQQVPQVPADSHRNSESQVLADSHRNSESQSQGCLRNPFMLSQTSRAPGDTRSAHK